MPIDQLLKLLTELSHNPLVLMLVAAVLVRARDKGVEALRADAAKKLADSNPRNDPEARVEQQVADALAGIKIPLDGK